MKPGYDGDIIALEEIRDHAGKDKRDLVRWVRYDVVDRLYKTKAGPVPKSGPDMRSGLLDWRQHEGAVRLQVDWQLSLAAIRAPALSERIDGARYDFGFPEAKRAAAARHEAAKRAVGPFRWPIVELVVECNFNLAKTAAAVKLEQLRVLPRLREGLDLLADHYGLPR